MRYGILGSGAGGQALAWELSTNGNEVLIGDQPEFGDQVAAIRDAGGVTRRTADGQDSFAAVAAAGAVADVVSACDVVFVASTAWGMRPFARAARPCLRPRQTFLLTPDTGGGILEFRAELGLGAADPAVVTSGCDTLPYAARVVGPARVRIKLFARNLQFATLPKAALPDVAALLGRVWPEPMDKFFTCDSVLRLILENTNPVIHPAVTLLNASRIESTGGDFLFYHEGVTDASADLLQAVDEERIALGRALGFELVTEPEASWLSGYIDADKVDYRRGYNQSPGFGVTKAPSTLQHRYLTEDVGFGLVLLSSLGDLLDVATPVADALIVIASVVLGQDYRALGLRTAETLGITASSLPELL